MTDRKATRKRRLFYWPDAKMAEKISAFAALLKKIQWHIDGGYTRSLKDLRYQAKARLLAQVTITYAGE
ncbi:hypothetical protein [Agrobacterium sp.]|jgi:hypothetical protein|uniref:hypothetical protein n=1 Tax=Agrobacterium sp. TaxID=361 RepID=UPI0028AA4842